MRKIILTLSLEGDLLGKDFEIVDAILLKDGDNPVLKFKEKIVDDPLSKYTAAEREKIKRANEILKKNQQEEMTEDEIKYLLDPEGFNKWCSEVPTAEELQFLSGFIVKRIAVPIDKCGDE